MTKKRALIIAGIFLGVVGLVIAAFYFGFEKVEEETFKPPAGEARTNPYLALERFLAADGWKADTVMTLTEPNRSDSLLIMTGSTADYGPEQIAAWDSWATGGGHLVMTDVPRDFRRKDDMTEHFGFGAPPEPEPVDPILDELTDEDSGSSTDEAEKDKKDSQSARESAKDEAGDEAGDEADEADEELLEEISKGLEAAESEPTPRWGPAATIPEGIQTTRFQANCPGVDLELPPEADRVWLGHNDCLVAASLPHGEGRVTLVPEIEIFDNTSIREYQHPKLAHDLFWQAPGSLENGATISLYGKRISWIGYLWGLFWPMCATLLIILAFALLAGTRRFGPLVAPPPTERRKRTEHVIAIGRFLWKHESADALLKATQDALLQSVGRGTMPRGLDRDEKAKWLADRTGVSVDEARRMLAQHAPTNPEVFANLIKSMEDLRRR